MSEYTKGPWKVHVEPAQKNTPTLTGANHYDAEYVAVVAANGEVIADNAHYYAASLDPANARLIAAAPELLEALKGILDSALGKRLEEDDITPSGVIGIGAGKTYFSQRLKDARKALTRATQGAV